MKSLEEIGNEIGFTTKSKNYRKAFYDKYIRTTNYDIITSNSDLIHIFDLKDKLNWYNICKYQKLSESFIREFIDKLKWTYICIYQKLSESFMREFSDKLDWPYISIYQVLSESFIREFQDKLDWSYISESQKLSESFMREFKDKVDWYNISAYQKLTEEYIREFKNKLEWPYISKYQKLSESFIREFGHKLHYPYISKYQYSDDKLFEHSSNDLNLYEIIDGYVYGYKAVRLDRYSLFNFQYKYEDGSIHESHSDQTDEENSFGLSIGTKKFANEYGICSNQYILLYVRTKISDITRIVHDGQKLRSRRIEVINEVEK